MPTHQPNQHPTSSLSTIPIIQNTPLSPNITVEVESVLMMKSLAISLALAVSSCEAFTSPSLVLQSASRLAASDSDENQDDTPFALPAPKEDNKVSIDLSKGSSIKIDGVASPKFQLQYTCKICDFRNSVKVSRHAYTKGIVIAKCKGCDCRHLIADNLNWLDGFDYDKGEMNIEQYMANRSVDSGNEDLVARVDKKVFDLEKVLYQSPDEPNVLSSPEEDGGIEEWA